MADNFVERMQSMVDRNKILLFVKGTKSQPQCGFSAQTIQIFNQLEKPFETVDILAYPEIRARMEEFSKWPTFPQVFIGGRFIGGCDIATEMYESGELKPLVEKAFEKETA